MSTRLKREKKKGEMGQNNSVYIYTQNVKKKRTGKKQN